jgi:hypothetical protein
VGILLPRRKYGRLTKAIPPTPPEKCRFCKHGRKCPVHPEGAYKEAMKKKKAKEKARRKKRGY